MLLEPFIVEALVNKGFFAKTLIDSGCLCYRVISKRLARKYTLKRIPITPRPLNGVSGASEMITEVVCVDLDIDGF